MIAGSPQARMGIGQNPNYPGGITPNNSNMGFQPNPNLYPGQAPYNSAQGGGSFMNAAYGGNGNSGLNVLGGYNSGNGTQQGVTGGGTPTQGGLSYEQTHNADGSPIRPPGAPNNPAGNMNGSGNSSIDALINGYMSDVKSSDANNTSRYNDASNFLKGIPGQYNSSPTTQGTQSLVQKFLQNPDVLSPQMQQQISNQTNNTINASSQNGLNNTNNILAASGDNDSSTMAAASQAANRNAIGQMGNASTNLGIQAAQLNNTSMQNAIGAGQRQSQQDINVPMQVGQTIMQNIPQQRPNDPSGIAAIIMAQQNQQFQQQMMNQFRPQTPSTGAGPSAGGNSAISGSLYSSGATYNPYGASQNTQYNGGTPQSW